MEMNNGRKIHVLLAYANQIIVKMAKKFLLKDFLHWRAFAFVGIINNLKIIKIVRAEYSVK